MTSLSSFATEKVNLSESGASSSVTTGAGTARLGSENSWSGALARIGSEFAGASHICFPTTANTNYL